MEQLGYTNDGEPTYILSVQASTLSWGADASSFKILLDVGVQAAGGAIGAAIYGLARDIASRLSGEDRPLTEAEAAERAASGSSARASR